MSIKILTYENTPCWYELFFKNTPTTLGLRIHKEFIDNIKFDLSNSPIVKILSESLKLSDFKSDFSKDIGFSGYFKNRGEKDNFINYEIEIPQVKIITDEPCKECKGTGINIYYESECLYCHGRGKQIKYNFKKALSISATFSALTPLLSFCEKETACSYPQLFTVETITKQDMHGGSIWGKISIPLTNYLTTFPDNTVIPEMKNAMLLTYNKLFGLNEFDKYNINAYISGKGRFIANCPGDACGIHPSDFYPQENRGYEFSCHNVGNAAQQLTLIAGLAALHDKARASII